MDGGSSPRGRGKLEIVPDVRRVVGLIPARAGKTPARRRRGRRRKAHPRAGGENRQVCSWASPGAGSSPRGRGKPRTGRAGGCPRRLIPARAGKTLPRLGMGTTSQAHPRAGGENNGAVSLTLSQYGSSPRGRGKPRPVPASSKCDRLIPARAGKTLPGKASTHPHRAHPRAGGENPSAPRRSRFTLGSSPRGRGKRRIEQDVGLSARLIPARAGKTRRPHWSPR